MRTEKTALPFTVGKPPKKPAAKPMPKKGVKRGK